jgi:hypothetical protein
LWERISLGFQDVAECVSGAACSTVESSICGDRSDRATNLGDKLHLIIRRRRHFVAAPTASFVTLQSSDLNRRTLGGGRPSIDQTLVSGRQLAANDADRVQLVDPLCDRQQGWDGAERLAAEVHVGSGDDDPGDHSSIEKMHLIDSHDLGPALHLLGNVS